MLRRAHGCCFHFKLFILEPLFLQVPSDPGALTRLGQIFAKDDDETQAFHYHFEAYR